MIAPRRNSVAGFTLIELMVVIAIIAIVATIAVPNLIRAKDASNESSAIASLRMLSSAQVECGNRGFIDADGDGRGEFGFFGELSGAIPARNNPGAAMVPQFLLVRFSR